MADGRAAGSVHSARAFELLEPLVQAATVRVHAPPDGYEDPGTRRTWGSGFFVAPGWVLTCAHVVGEGGAGVRLAGREVGITFAPGEAGDAGATGTVAGRVECVLPESLEQRRPGRRGLWQLPDLALIRVLAPVTHACVWLTDRARPPRFEDVAYFGCTEDLGVPEITGRTTRLRGAAGAGKAIRLGADDEIVPGMSGGPVVDLARGEVVGVVKARRQEGGGGLAVSIVQLRTLPPAGPGQVGLYRRVLQAHDLYHYDQHLSDLDSRRTWTDVQGELPAAAQAYGTRLRLTPGERTTLYGLLAELPAPRSSEAVRSLVEAARGEEPDSTGPAPLSWRDGIGLLYDPPGGVSEAAAMLRYATDVSVADHREPPTPGADEELWDWVRATAERLWRPLRRELGERHERGLAERDRRRAVAARPVHGPLRAPDALPPGPSVLLEAWSHGWEEVYDWRVSVLGGPDRPAELTPVDSGVRVPPQRLPEALRAPLAEAFRRCDTHEAAALLEVAVAPELFTLAVDEWPVTGDTPVGVQRPVVYRYPADGPCADDPLRAADRWTRVMTGPALDQRADCSRGRPRSPSYGWLSGLPDHVVPVSCRSADCEPALGALHAARRAGYGVVLCRRPPPGEVSCAAFHRGLREELAEAGRGRPLPLRLLSLRVRAHDHDPDAYWSTGLGLVWEDPDRPLPEDEPLQGDL
ncbi:VMAP-C domain-containing protein [Streptomyces antimicrobicus]|uniref:Serine protease n=1 Tax=Streptomyces antimicrobicus TaxID=2883108 RepID=A0ABS8B6F2_9ACTN|nr:trypsin-like peptidase domain-containing protein [Streptomyces antimicrobicus]MCB5180175.1 serine protease [Streptomyces antimicrobicus]